MKIEIFELTNTFGCAWREQGSEKANYGFNGLPNSAALWLGCVGGGAVERILDIQLGTVIDTKPGSYGGTCRTILVDVDELEKACKAYWDRMNARAARQRERQGTCHYCGQDAKSTGFFDEPVCKECV
jgi:hypothetical protein